MNEQQHEWMKVPEVVEVLRIARSRAGRRRRDTGHQDKPQPAGEPQGTRPLARESARRILPCTVAYVNYVVLQVFCKTDDSSPSAAYVPVPAGSQYGCSNFPTPLSNEYTTKMVYTKLDDTAVHRRWAAATGRSPDGSGGSQGEYGLESQEARIARRTGRCPWVDGVLRCGESLPRRELRHGQGSPQRHRRLLRSGGGRYLRGPQAVGSDLPTESVQSDRGQETVRRGLLPGCSYGVGIRSALPTVLPDRPGRPRTGRAFCRTASEEVKV